jgi:diguanylate cyclase (GGDEF)-like protein
MNQPGTVLVVDDRESNRMVLRDMLESAGHRTLSAEGGEQAIELAVAHRPDVILLDVKMPGMDGFEVCAKLQTFAETASIPIVFVTANLTDGQDMLHGLEIGAYDYLVKPISRAVLLARVGVMLRIRRSEERARRLSMIDEFTGLFSKNYVVRRLDEEIQRAQRRDSPLTVTMIDLDDFKLCNDTYGHQFGDDVLKRVSAILNSNTRLYDSVGRYGGEEFLIVQPEISENEAVAMIERLQERVQAERFPGKAKQARVSFSAGIATWDHECKAEELIQWADSALYAAKRAGKNQTVRYSEILAGVVPVVNHRA